MSNIQSCQRIVASFVVGMMVTCFSSALASQPGQVAAARVSEQSYRHYLDDMLYTHIGDARGLTGPEHDLARDNIAMLMSSFGLNVTLEPFDYQGTTYYNVVGEQTGTADPGQVYVVGAHFDSFMFEDPEGGNAGADDDASGVALVLEAARVLSDYESDYTIRYIAFDREEQWMIGSYAYVIDHVGDNILGMVNADMVAYNSGVDTVRVAWWALPYPIVESMLQAVSMYGGGLASAVTNVPGDHLPFEEFGFPACVLADHDYTDPNPYVHTADDHVDLPDYIDYAYATKITRVAVGFLVDHAGVQVMIPDADFDGDGDVDGDDFAQFELCFAGSGNPVDPPCDFFDFEADGDVDCLDWRIFEALWTGPPDDPPIFVACNALPPDLLGVGNRCIVLDPLGSSTPMAIYVTGAVDEPVVDCVSAYVQTNNHLGSSPVFQSPEDWGTVVVCDDEILPGTSYYVQSDYGQPGSPLRSPTSRVTTSLWGDTAGDFLNGEWTPPNGIVDFMDILAVVEGFRNLPTAPSTYLVDLVGASGSECVPDQNIDFLDISAAVEAFKGNDYWEATGCPPPCD